MVKLKCPKCKHEWNFRGNPRGRGGARCSNNECRKWFKMTAVELTTWKEENTPKKIIVDVGAAYVTKRGGTPKNPSFSEFVINLTISNPSDNKIGISRIVGESHVKEFPLMIKIRDWDTGMKMSYFTLESKETKTVVLYNRGMPIIMSFDKIPATIWIKDENQKEIFRTNIDLDNTGWSI